MSKEQFIEASEGVPADDRSHQFLLARHLEVFVPKPSRRSQERELLGSLDDLLLRDQIPMAQSSKELCVKLIQLDQSVASWENIVSWEDGVSWENVVCGYSTYQTDGHFLGLLDIKSMAGEAAERRTEDRFGRGRLKNYWRETTLVIKFILTNYATVVEPRDQCLDAMVGRLTTEGGESRKIVAGLHLRDIGDHIVGEIERGVLWNEEEVWAHSWYTVLDRRCTTSRMPPIVLDAREKKSRFAGKANHVLCVTDYIDDKSLARLHGRDGKPLARTKYR